MTIEFIAWAGWLSACGLLLLAAMLRARVYELQARLKDKQAVIESLKWTKQDEQDVTVIDDPRDAQVTDWLDRQWAEKHPTVDNVAQRTSNP